MDEIELSFLRALDEVAPPEGIDVGIYRKDVRRYVLARFRGRLRMAQIDPEDAIAEVCMGLVIRNRGICPWRPGGRSRASYVYMVTECVISNMVRRSLLRVRRQVPTLMKEWLKPTGDGPLGAEGGGWVPLKPEDIHQHMVESQPADVPVDGVLLDDMEREFSEQPHVRTWLRCATQGVKRQDIQRRRLLTSWKVTDAQRRVLRFLAE